MADDYPTPAELRAAFSYDPATGAITRINGQRPGRQVGYDGGKGYLVVQYKRRGFMASRLAWLLHYGEWPRWQVDHWNGIKRDNRIDNLRDVPPLVNSQNQHRARRTNACGHLGASKTPEGRFVARMFHAGRRVYLGVHDTPEAAHAAYQIAKKAVNFPTGAASIRTDDAQPVDLYGGAGRSRTGLKRICNPMCTPGEADDT